MRMALTRSIAAIGVGALLGAGVAMGMTVATASSAQAQFVKPVQAPADLSPTEIQWRGGPRGPRGPHVAPRPGGPRYAAPGVRYRPPPPGRYYGRRYGPPPRYYGRPYPPPGYYYGPGYNAGAAAAAGAAGLAAGALIGGAIASQQAAPVVRGDPDWIAYCSSKYRSFDPASGTYLGYDGRRHICQ
ncbi:BA14K-like protein [Chelatococcus asaccharovorans]|uniref:Lectin-like protein BA14k n=2 Tax=Chelatococcus asaccharovorans TaxID=28210 RepID=A0A2V3U305_9HYPH|nr:BA14K-like protein [Chelatococcus asaccharovorans]